MLFDFLLDGLNYESRKVSHSEIGDAVIDTTAVSDGSQSFETGVKHPEFNDGKWIIVEAYDTKEEAQRGHECWVVTITENLPDQLTDCQNSEISQFLPKDSLIYPRTRKKR